MAALTPPQKPKADATITQIEKYQTDLTAYKLQVEQVAEEIQALCKEVFAQCEQLGNSPMRVMESVSAIIWSGRASMEFIFEGGQKKQSVLNSADEIREAIFNIMKSTNSKLSSI